MSPTIGDLLAGFPVVIPGARGAENRAASPVNSALQSSQSAPAPDVGLSSFGLPASPFVRVPTRPQRLPPPPPAARPLGVDEERLPPSEFDDVGKSARALIDRFGPEKDEPEDILARVERIMRGLPPLPGPEGYIEGRRPDGTILNVNSLAFTPTEGPDTGELNPNTGGDYYAMLRRPEGTVDNPNARNKITGASGPFQFLRGTWDDLAKDPSLQLTPEGFDNPSDFMDQHDRAIRAYTKRSEDVLRPYLGRAPNAGELYSLHFFGQAGGMNFLKNLSRPIRETLPASYFRDNPWLKSWADRDGYALMTYFNKLMG